MEKTDYLVISANCIAGFWYEDVVKTKYEHPFIWSITKLSDMLFLIKNFDTINFKNIEAKYTTGEVNRHDGNVWPKILLENKVSSYFVHVKKSPTPIEKPIISGTNVICNDVLGYLTDVWKRRAERIPYNKKRVWVFWDDAINSNVELSEFINLAADMPNEIFVLFSPENGMSPLSKNMIILPITDYTNVRKHVKDLEIALSHYED